MTVEVDNAFADRTEELVWALADGNYGSVVDAFAPEFKSEFVEFLPPTYEPYLQPEPEPVLEEHWRSLTSLYGDLDSIENCRVDAGDDGGAVELSLQLADDPYSMRLEFDVNQQITALEFPAEYELPTYVEPEAYTERELTVQASEIELGATLSVPNTVDDPPGVVLVHGAGGHGRDYAAGPNKFLKDLACGLASNGVAVLRYDKRTFVEDLAEEDQDIDTVVVNDAVAAANRLAETEAVASDRVFVVGHSLGAMCAPRIASRHGGVAGIGMLDGVPMPFTQTMPRMVRDRWQRDGAIEEYGQRQLENVEAETKRVESGDVDDAEVVLGFPGAWWNSLHEYDHAAEAASVSLPTYVALSGRDSDLYETAYERWQELLPASRLRAEYYPDLNHYYQSGTLTAGLLEPVVFRKPPAERVVSDLAAWITESSR